MEVPESVGELTETLRQGGYLADRGLATALFVAVSLDRPILLEGEVGVGKTEVAKVMASVFGRKLIRLQCYEGIDTNQALYEWDYARQMLHIRALSDHQVADPDAVDKLFGPKFLLERPLLEAVRAGDRAVLLIDEIDRADDEFEAFLLEVLSDFQISIPEIGTIKAVSPPLVVFTSNRTRELHDALKRRCLYHWIGYPAAEREVEIVLIREPGISAALARKVVAAVQRLRELDLAKPPGVAETIDWARTLDFLGEPDLANARDTLGAVVKDRDDLEVVLDNLQEITSGARGARAGARSVHRAAGGVRGRAPRGRAGRGVGGRPALLLGAGAAEPGRPGRPVLGRPDHAGEPARRHRRLRPGVPPLLPGRRRGGERSVHPHAAGLGGGAGRAGGTVDRTGRIRRRGRRDSGLDGLGRGGAQAQVVRRLHAGGTRGLAPDHGQDQADPAAAPDPAQRAGPDRPAARSAAHGTGSHAHARRADPVVLAAAEGPAAAADPPPGRIRFDGRLLAQPAAVRALGGQVSRPGRGVLLRHPADPGDRGDAVPAPR